MPELKENETRSDDRASKSMRFWIVVGVITIIVIVGGGYYFANRKDKVKNSLSEEMVSNSPIKSWSAERLAVAGQYADADVVDLGNGQYRMYYSAEPEVAGFKGQLYSAVSTDGATWTAEDGIRKEWAIFPDVLKLPDGRYRLYYQSAGLIKSAVSADGVNFSDETGIRIGTDESGFDLDTVGASSTIILPDGSYIMVYRGTIKQKYQTSEIIPNDTTQIYFYATSSDGLNFNKKGLAIDSRNETLYGLADGAEWAKWDDSTLRVYFWSYSGIYQSLYENGAFSIPAFDYSNNNDSRAKFVPNPPSDPTLIKIKDTWFMYYGQHTKGIYYTEYK